MTPEQLKVSILQSAFQGKLVTVSDYKNNDVDGLIKSIHDEKLALEKNGKIKKVKKLPEITESECPYDIPSSWRWVRLNDIVFNHGQKTPDKTFSYIDIGSIDNIHQKLNDEENLIEADNAPSRARKIVEYGDIIYATVRPYLHNTCIIDKQFKAEPIASTGFAVLTCHKGVLNKYLFYYLLSPAFDSYANATDNAKGVAYPAINDDKLYRAVVPLPLLEEQHRIVAKIEELLPYVDRYAEAYEKLEQFNAKFPEDMKKSILQYAIQGKLVEQRPEEGTAEELYQQIQDEKQKLIKEGKIKKSKIFPDISEDEIPFDLPDNWRWVRVSDVCSILNGDRGKNYPAKSTLKKEGIPFISALNLDGKTVKQDDDLLCLSDEQYEKLGNGKLIKDDIVVCIRGSLGKHGRYPFDKGAIASSLVICRQYLKEDVLAEYFMMYLDAPLFYSLIKLYDNGTAQPNLAANSFEQFLFPLPPIGEQKRIVNKVKELLPYCERLGK